VSSEAATRSSPHDAAADVQAEGDPDGRCTSVEAPARCTPHVRSVMIEPGCSSEAAWCSSWIPRSHAPDSTGTHMDLETAQHVSMTQLSVTQRLSSAAACCD